MIVIHQFTKVHKELNRVIAERLLKNRRLLARKIEVRCVALNLFGGRKRREETKLQVLLYTGRKG